MTIRFSGSQHNPQSRVSEVVVETVRRYRSHRLGRQAALLAYYGFLSVFPLLVGFTAVLGFVLHGDEGLQRRIVDSTIAQLPVIGQQLKSDPGSLRGNAIVIALAVVTAAWAALRAFVVAHETIDNIAGVPRAERLGLVRSWLRSLATIAVIGSAQVLTAVAAGLLSASRLGWLAQAGIIAASAIIDIALVALAFRLLCSRTQRWTDVAPGAVFAGLAFAALQMIGSLVVGRAIARATPVYGTYASVIGALTWLSLHASVSLAAFEMNLVVAEHRQAG